MGLRPTMVTYWHEINCISSYVFVLRQVLLLRGRQTWPKKRKMIYCHIVFDLYIVVGEVLFENDIVIPPTATTTITTTTTARENKTTKLGKAALMVEIGLTDAKAAVLHSEKQNLA